jgi:hypothetical protein
MTLGMPVGVQMRCMAVAGHEPDVGCTPAGMMSQ